MDVWLCILILQMASYEAPQRPRTRVESALSETERCKLRMTIISGTKLRSCHGCVTGCSLSHSISDGAKQTKYSMISH